MMLAAIQQSSKRQEAVDACANIGAVLVQPIGAEETKILQDFLVKKTDSPQRVYLGVQDEDKQPGGK